MTATTAIGIDIGGTGIKGAVVDLSTGDLLSERVKLPTPKGGRPQDIIETTRTLLGTVSQGVGDLPVGICFPAVVKNGHTMSAANVSSKWIGLAAEALFEKSLGLPIHFINDADAAGYAEAQFGAARDVAGVVLLTTLGTGIGSALLNDGVLVPNTELGHLQIDGHDYETRAAYSAKERENLSWDKWASRLQKYYTTLELLFTPDLFIVGGGVSKHHEDFLPLLRLKTRIIPAVHRNNAGILGAAALAARFPG
ncbi:ROK family protein [Cryobacterium levicorallinum]|uniref:Polyphosphate glucokinase n=1 Tax=Cryobacterium levicorallinum TaxID=995038 RepID=A0A1I2Z763_9MICO|nr:MULTISPECIES: ROK family protein [Cryobacterium]TFB82875.1 ROK family protein [Cryobacterium levicorallinum]GEP25678.1 polyphosphate glucokinase [Cryobacterium levicorallinum]SFH33425.1 polyphosphate glucokinase [Cryobacterium levicorallinum]